MISCIYHITPLHHLCPIAKSGVLLSKAALLEEGFSERHFRSTSWKTDVARGFARYVHFSTAEQAPILRSKLGSGFPHVELSLPLAIIPGEALHMCRYNIARTRVPGPDGPTNGYKRFGCQVPTAYGEDECMRLVQLNPQTEIFEVLAEGRLSLPETTAVIAYDERDADAASRILRAYGRTWPVSVRPGEIVYPRRPDYAGAVAEEIERYLRDDTYRGSGLDYDALKPEITMLD